MPNTRPQNDEKVGQDSGQGWVWVLGVTFLVIALGLGMYMLVAGLNAAGQLASVVGAMAAIAGLMGGVTGGFRWQPHLRFSRKALIGAAIAALATIVTVSTVIVPRLGHGTVPPSPPPGRKVVDDGRAFGPRGSSRFTVTIDPANTGVRVIRRLDAGIALQSATITVNGTRAGQWQPLPIQLNYRWRDQSIYIPQSLTAGQRSLTIVNTFISSTQDFNEFAYFIDHKVDERWSTSDILDIGPDHLASEDAHHYRISEETFAGPRAYEYPR
ncbi:MAG TPA: hypothetical protein VE465_01810 [Streptosporangiaceae bacterium]|jgi:hypothetical protein|nr:hypothetical protein [Streptosporangiaceae bacterium]